MYFRVRKEITDYLKINRNNYENIELATEEGMKNIDDYIIYTQQEGKWSGELEKYACLDIYNIIIADYKQITDKNLIPQYHQFIYNLNQGNDYNKVLCLLTNINNNHFNLLFDKNIMHIKLK